MKRSVGVFLAEAFSTNSKILATAEKTYGRRARISNSPSNAITPAKSSLPAAASTGTDSPVSADASTELRPLSTTPSSGTRSPGRTKKTSPLFTVSGAVSTHASPRRKSTVSGLSSIKERTLRRERCTAQCRKNSPVW